MNKKLILILVLALAMANATDLAFNLGNTRYTKGSDFWTVDVPCSGGSGSYQYECDLPTGWRLESNQFKIPSSCSTNYNYEYVSRCRVKDINLGAILERALAFKCTTSGYVITDKDYFYGQTSFSSGMGTISGMDVLQRLTTLTSSISTSFGSIGSLGTISGLNVLGGLTGSYGGVFAAFPSWTDCDNLIKNGNIVEILALIQKVVSSTTLRCEAKVAYLNDLLGRINAALKIKRESIGQIQALIDGLLVQIQKLTAQITALQNEQAALNLAGLKAQLDALILKVQDYYNQYNTCVASTADYEKELAALKQELVALEDAINKIKCLIDDCTAKLNQLDIDIAALEKKLAELKAERQRVAAQCADLNAQLKAKQDRLLWVKDRIQWLLNKISEIQGNCALIKQTYEKLECDLKALKDKYDAAVCRSNEIDQQIASINVEIKRLQDQIAAYQAKLKLIQQCIDNLNGAIKEIYQSIHFVQFSCHDCNNVQIDVSDIEPCFRFGRNDWFSYLSKCYAASLPQIQVSFPTVSVDIKPITIFSPIFEINYGSCFGDQIKNRGSQWDNQGSFGFDNDFSCSSSYQSVETKRGKIRAINNKYVDVDCDDGQQVRLKLGSCSRFEGQGKDFVPKTGHTIHFKGARNVDSTWNLHTCTCY